MSHLRPTARPIPGLDHNQQPGYTAGTFEHRLADNPGHSCCLDHADNAETDEKEGQKGRWSGLGGRKKDEGCRGSDGKPGELG